MATQLATAYYQLMPSMAGNEAQIRQAAGAMGQRAGEEGGRRLGSAMGTTAAGSFAADRLASKATGMMRSVGERLGSVGGTGIGSSLSRAVGSTLTSRTMLNALGGVTSGCTTAAGMAMNTLGRGFQAAATVGATAVAGLGTILSTSLSKGIERADQLNAFPKVMANLGYSSADADKEIRKIADSLDGLPTTTNEVASTVQRLTPILSGGMSEATDVSLALNNAMLAGGASTQAAAAGMEQYAQMLATGKVDMQAWKSLQASMPGQLDQIAKALLGPTANTSKLYDAMSSGQVTFDDFNKAMVKLNKEGANGLASFEEQARSATAGIGTSLQLLTTRTGATIADFIEAIGVDRISGALNDLSSGIREFGKDLTEAVTGPVTLAGRNIGGLVLAAGSAIPTFTTLANTCFRVGGSMSSLITKVTPIGGLLTGVVGGVFSFVTVLLSAWSASENFRSACGQLVTALSEAKSEAQDSGVFDTFVQIMGRAAEIVGDTLAFAITNVLIPALETLSDIAAKVGEWFGKSSEDSESLAIEFAAVGVAALQLNGMVKKVTGFNTLRTSLNLLKPVMSGMGTTILNTITWLGRLSAAMLFPNAASSQGTLATLGVAIDVLKGKALTATTHLKNFGKALTIQNLSNTFSSALSTAGSALSKFGKTALISLGWLGLIVGAIMAVVYAFTHWEEVKQWPGKIATWLSQVWNSFVTWLGGVGPWLQTNIPLWGQAIWNWVVNVATSLPGWLASIATSIWNWVVNTAVWIGQNLGTWTMAIWNWVVSVAGSIWTWLGSVWNSIATWVSSVDWSGKLQEWGTKIWNWVASVAANLPSWMAQVWNAIYGWASTIDWAGTLGTWATNIFNWAMGVANNMGTWMGNIWTAIVNWFNSVDWATQLQTWADTVWQWICDLSGNIGTWMGDIWNAIVNWFNNIDWGEVWNTIVTTVSTWVQNMITWLSENLPGIVQGIIDWFINTGIPMLQDIITNIITWLVENGPTVLKWLTIIVLGLIAALLVLILAAIVLALVAIVALIVGLLVGLWNAIWEVIGPWIGKIGEFFANIWNTIWTFLQNCWNWICNTWNNIWTFLSNLLTNIKNFFSNIWNTITTWLSMKWLEIKTKAALYFGMVKQKIEEVFNNVKNFFTNIWNTITTWVSMKWLEIKTKAALYFGMVKQKIQEAFQNVKNKITEIWNNITTWISDKWNAIKNKAIEIFTNIRDKIRDTWNNIWNKIREFVTNIYNKIRDGFNDAKNAVQEKISNIKQTIQDKVGEMVNKVKELPDKAKEALGDLGSKLFQAGKDLIQGFIDGIGDMFGSVADKCGELTDKLTEWKGPEKKDRILLTPVGELIIEGFIVGLEEQFDNVKKSLHGLTASIPVWMSQQGEIQVPDLRTDDWADGEVTAMGGPRITVVNNNPREKSDMDIRAEVADGIRMADMLR